MIRFLLVLCAIGLVSYGNGLDSFSNCSEIVRVRPHCFILCNGTKSVIHDRYTQLLLAHELFRDQMRWVDPTFVATIPDGPEVESLWDNHPNDRMHSMGSSPFLLETHKLLSLQNPSFVQWNDYIALAWRPNEKRFRVMLVPRSADRSLQADMAVLSTVDVENAGHLSVLRNGEDPRLFVADGKLWVMFAKRYHGERADNYPELQMHYAELGLMAGTLAVKKYVRTNATLEDPGREQKNWMPFVPLASSTASATPFFFIGDIQPHRILGTVWKGAHQQTFTLHQSSMDGFAWAHGELRGGTNAVRLNEQFLTFFHSSNDPSPPAETGHFLKTYVMGAYVFCAHPPYHIMAISRQPVVHPSMYSGQWTNLPKSVHFIDYVVFPTSLFVDGDVVHVLYGSQDREGWVATMSLKGLLASMQTVNSSCNAS